MIEKFMHMPNMYILFSSTLRVPNSTCLASHKNEETNTSQWTERIYENLKNTQSYLLTFTLSMTYKRT